MLECFRKAFPTEIKVVFGSVPLEKVCGQYVHLSQHDFVHRALQSHSKLNWTSQTWEEANMIWLARFYLVHCGCIISQMYGGVWVGGLLAIVLSFWVVRRLYAALCPAAINRPQCSLQGLYRGSYRDGEACWLIISIITPSLVPQE